MTGPGPVVVAIGGNALVPRSGVDDLVTEVATANRAARAIAPLAAGGLVVTHGNGPQVGALARGAELSGRAVPLHVLVAQSQGQVGHVLQLALAAALPEHRVRALLTHVVVDPDDVAFAAPAKPIGAGYERHRAEALAAELGWTVARDGHRWRRVVASPEPIEVVELDAVRALLEAGTVVVTAGGGGIPVAAASGLTPLEGIDAVVDKDLTSALLAAALDASTLVLLTDVDAVHRDWDGSTGTPIARAGVDELRRHRFEPGTMGPKVEAACRFSAATGRSAHIGSLEDAAAVAAGRAGTTVHP